MTIPLNTQHHLSLTQHKYRLPIWPQTLPLDYLEPLAWRKFREMLLHPQATKEVVSIPLRFSA